MKSKQHRKIASLNDRVHQFLTQMDGFEFIDTMSLTPSQQEGKKADFLAANKTAVIEIKSIESDPEYKVQNELEKISTRDDYPLFLGEMELSKILKHMPDGSAVNEKLFYKVSRSIAQAFQNANTQILNTMTAFNCADAYGILVLLNESVDILSPHIIAHRVSQLLTERLANDALRYQGISCAYIIQENFKSTQLCNTVARPCITIFGPKFKSDSRLSAIIDKIENGWAKHCNTTLIIQSTKRIEQTDFAVIKNEPFSFELSRAEQWKRDYRKKRTLQALTDTEVISYGKQITSILKPHFLISGTKLPNSVVAKLFKEWNYFLEEVRIRGLNLKQPK